MSMSNLVPKHIHQSLRVRPCHLAALGLQAYSQRLEPWAPRQYVMVLGRGPTPSINFDASSINRMVGQRGGSLVAMDDRGSASCTRTRVHALDVPLASVLWYKNQIRV